MAGGWGNDKPMPTCEDKGLAHVWTGWGLNFGVSPSNETRECRVCHIFQSRHQTKLSRTFYHDRPECPHSDSGEGKKKVRSNEELMAQATGVPANFEKIYKNPNSSD